MARRHRFASGVTGYTGMPSRTEVIELARVNAREMGCDCDVEIALPDDYGRRGTVTHIEVRHDPDCPLMES